MATLKPQSNGPLYSNTVIRSLAVDGWAQGRFDRFVSHLVLRGGAWAGCGSAQSPL